ncbi:TonB-dependent receptor [Acidobacterium sp. S8]|uniref:TonB-dependent receptor n=1 Tax=Acidobacterium sp. S8 TaxID=1641854 RepID=UPI00131BA0C0|nr:TonB-dependent receptor [Acidobacterium sp. S8]
MKMKIAATLRLASLHVSMAALTLVIVNVPAHGQKATGSVEGIVTDPAGALVPNARITAIDENTGLRLTTVSDASGFYHFVDIRPDLYTLVVEAPGFKRLEAPHLLVQIAHVSPFNATVQLGSNSEEVTVNAGGATDLDPISTESGEVINAKQIEELPIVGRSAMDLAQLSPGVQLQDGNDVDPTKENFTVAAFQGRSGRNTQVQLDGISIMDHSVGGPVQNTGIDAVQEFQVAEATLNPAQSVASGGAVNILTRSGGNQLHGSAFEFFRDRRIGARIGPVASPYDRNQLGGRIGGAFIPNRLFFFVNYELTDTRDSYYANTIFPNLNGFHGKPFRSNFVIGRLDYTLGSQWKLSAEYSYSPNHGVVGYPQLGDTYLDGLVNKTQAIIAEGTATRAVAHNTQSIAYGFNSYSQALTPDPNSLAPTDAEGRKYLLLIDGGATLAYGVNILASQFQKQHSHDGKYDATFDFGRHTLAFGTDLTYWILGTYYSLREAGPELDTDSYLGVGLTDPTQFPLTGISMGNALGYWSERGALGFDHGAFPEWRPAAYIHDTWRATKNLTLNAGLRYVFMSGQFDVNTYHDQLLDTFRQGYAGYRHNPKTDFGPQIGGAWNVGGSGNTVVRAGAGIYFEELTFDGFYGDAANFIPAGIASASQTVSKGAPVLDPRTGTAFAAGDPLATQYGFPNGTSGAALAPLFSESIGAASTSVINLNHLYIAAAAQNTSSATPFDLNHALYNSSYVPGTKNPRVAQVTAAVEHKLSKNLSGTAEYIWVHGYEFPLSVDENHIGSASTTNFDKALAAQAIFAGNASLGCPASLAGTDCAIANGATISTYGAYGLGAGFASNGYAFRGVNPNFGTMNFFEHRGMNTYNGLNLRLDAHFGQPDARAFLWMKGNIVTAAYTYSHNVGNIRSYGSGESDIANQASTWDTNSPNHFVGPDSLDRRSMLNVGTITDIRYGFTFSQITHWFSPLSNSPLLPTALGGCGGGPEEIFCTDWTGDGTTGDLLPTGGPGALGRSLNSPGTLNRAIARYNTNYAGKATPAGNQVVNQGLFSSAQLASLRGVMPALPLAPPNQVGLDLLLLTDARLQYSHKVWSERIAIEPSWDVFNIFNRSSYDAPSDLLQGTLSGVAGTANGTTPSTRTNLRLRGSGTYEQGARRQMQAGLRISF